MESDVMRERLAEEIKRDLNRPPNDEIAWEWFKAWWEGTGGALEELAAFVRVGDAYNLTPMRAMQRAIRYILNNQLWG